MDSIDRNQPEKNHEDLMAQEAIAKIKELVHTAESCFFCTTATTGDPVGTRPMAVQTVDDAGH
ncbi:MAG: general stress protein, partial [Verrucomicrobiota bacterium]